MESSLSVFFGILIILSLGAMVIGSIWMAVNAFKDSIKAGLAWLFIPFYFIVYLRNHWDRMKNPFCIFLVGIVCYFWEVVIFALVYAVLGW